MTKVRPVKALRQRSHHRLCHTVTALAAVSLIATALIPGTRAQAAGVVTEQISLSTTGTLADSLSRRSSLTEDGRYVAFTSRASNLVPGDTNGMDDVFVRDRVSKTTTRVSLRADGLESATAKDWAQITPDGRYVVFESGNDLDGGNGNTSVIYLRDLTLGTLERVDSVASPDSSYRPSITPDGRYVTYWSAAHTPQLYRKDRQTGAVDLVTATPDGAPGTTGAPSGLWPAGTTPDGRFVAFYSGLEDLVPGDTNGLDDVFIRDMTTGTTTRLNLSPAGEQANKGSWSARISLTQDGRYVVFESQATNLLPNTVSTYSIYLKDTVSGSLEKVNPDERDGANGYITGNGRYIGYETADGVWIKTRQTGTTANLGIPYNWMSQAAVQVTEDGHYATFSSYSDQASTGTNGQENVYLAVLAPEADRISVAADGGNANGHSRSPSLTADGRYVVFSSAASNLVSGDTATADDVFLRDRGTGVTTRLSVAADGTEFTARSTNPQITPDGRYVVFASSADLLKTGSRASGIYLRDLQTGTLERSDQSTMGSYVPSITPDGRYVTYWSYETDTTQHLYRKDRQTGVETLVTATPSGVKGTMSTGSPIVAGPAAISADGRFIAFYSLFDNLVTGDTNAQPDVFLRDMQAGTTVRLSAGADGTEADGYSRGPSISISDDGRYVLFESAATNLLPDAAAVPSLYLRDVQSGALERIGPGAIANSAMTPDARIIVYEAADGFHVVNRQSGATVKLADSSGYSTGGIDIGSDGRYIVICTPNALVPNDTDTNNDVYLLSNPMQ
jgi:Tol biopolymer transport system component